MLIQFGSRKTRQESLPIVRHGRDEAGQGAGADRWWSHQKQRRLVEGRIGQAARQAEEYDDRILGSGEFVNAVFSEIEERTRSQLKLRRSGVTISKIIDQECATNGLSIQELKGGGRRRNVSALRVAIAKRGLDELGLSLAEIARHVGVSTSAIARAVKRLEQRSAE